MTRFQPSRLSLAVASALGICSMTVHADVVVNEELRGASALYDWYSLNGACLTAGDGTGAIPACNKSPYKVYQGKTQVGGNTGLLPDVPWSKATPNVPGGALRLTNGDNATGDNGTFQTGAIVSHFTFPTDAGLQATWTSVTYGGNNYNGTGADGIGFFLADGAQEASVGGVGGSLGYTCSNINSIADGVNGGYIGIGMDEYGNFATQPDNTNTGRKDRLPGYISVRGAGSTNFAWLAAHYPSFYPSTANMVDAVHRTCSTGKIYNASQVVVIDSKGQPVKPGEYSKTDALPSNYPLITSIAFTDDKGKPISIANQERVATPLRSLAKPITYSLNIKANGMMTFSYATGGGRPRTVISDLDITKDNGKLPASFRFGFSGGTGGGSNVHEITCFKAGPSDQSTSSAGSDSQGQSAGGTQLYLGYTHAVNSWGTLRALPVIDNPAVGGKPAYLSYPQYSKWEANCVLTGVPNGGVCADTNQGPMPAQGPTARNILSWNGTGGVAFKASQLDSTQVTALTKGDAAVTDDRLNFLRGDRSKEVAAGGPFRTRTGVLGDIADSSPTWVGAPASPYANLLRDKLTNLAIADGATYLDFATQRAGRQNVVYVGANDGLLHGFRAGTFTGADFKQDTNDGHEVLAYMPAQVVNAIHSATSPNLDFSAPGYAHNYYVDASPGVGDLYYGGAWHTWLVGGLGSGGQAGGAVADFTTPVPGSVYALDITDPASFSESRASSLVLGDWTSDALTKLGCSGTSTCGDHLGMVKGIPVVRRLHDGSWGVLFGNGVNSKSGTAGLFILHIATDGTKSFQFIDTKVAGTAKTLNGIVQVTAADLDTDRITDYVYAADVVGNVWRFDLTSTSSSTWSAGAAPLFKTPGNQPVSTAVTVTSVAASNSTGFRKVIVAFGTGRKQLQTLTESEKFDQTKQTLYGIWDADMTLWNASKSDVKYDLLPTVSYPVGANNLQSQSITTTTTNNGTNVSYRTVSQNPVCWAGSANSGCKANSQTQMGWYLDLPVTNDADGNATVAEQTIYDPVTAYGLFIVNTTIPSTGSTLSCDTSPPGGFTMVIDMGTGGASPHPVLQNMDNVFTVGVAGISDGAVGQPQVMRTSDGGAAIVSSPGTPATPPSPPLNPPSDTGNRLNWTQLR